jgi:molybdopterin molybdotransferase
VGPQLPGLAGWFAADLTSTLLVPDSPPDHLAAALGAASADIVVTCGGVGPGLADPLRAALDRLRARSFVDGVACRPGHPQRLAQLPDGRWVVGLPGNPFAALVAAFTLLAPLVAGLAGRPLARLPTASLVSDVRARRGTTQLVPVRRLDGDRVEWLGLDRPGNLWGAALADALAVVPPGWAGQPVGLLALPR